jgi:hypothetical protein
LDSLLDHLGAVSLSRSLFFHSRNAPTCE